MKHTLDDLQTLRRFTDGPDWRWRFANALVSKPEWQAIRTDRFLFDAYRYLCDCSRESDHRKDTSACFSEIAAAEALAQDVTARQQLYVLVVAGCSPAEISAHVRIDQGVLAVWEALFFDVRAARDATCWIHQSVIPQVAQDNRQLAAKMKFAYAGGPYAAQAILTAETRVSLAQGVRLFDQKILLGVKLEEALQFPLESERDCRHFIKLHADLMYREKRLALEERKLAKRSQEALANQNLAERRLELSAKREEERAARRAQREVERQRLAEERRWFQRLKQLQAWGLEMTRAQEGEKAYPPADSITPSQCLDEDAEPGTSPGGRTIPGDADGSTPSEFDGFPLEDRGVNAA